MIYSWQVRCGGGGGREGFWFPFLKFSWIAKEARGFNEPVKMGYVINWLIRKLIKSSLKRVAKPVCWFIAGGSIFGRLFNQNNLLQVSFLFFFSLQYHWKRRIFLKQKFLNDFFHRILTNFSSIYLIDGYIKDLVPWNLPLEIKDDKVI